MPQDIKAIVCFHRDGSVSMKDLPDAMPPMATYASRMFEEHIKKARAEGREEIINNMGRAIERFARGE